jgi:hypothetical protein
LYLTHLGLMIKAQTNHGDELHITRREVGGFGRHLDWSQVNLPLPKDKSLIGGGRLAR